MQDGLLDQHRHVQAGGAQHVDGLDGNFASLLLEEGQGDSSEEADKHLAWHTRAAGQLPQRGDCELHLLHVCALAFCCRLLSAPSLCFLPVFPHASLRPAAVIHEGEQGPSSELVNSLFHTDSLSRLLHSAATRLPHQQGLRQAGGQRHR